jgi:hypothetical protein
MALIRPSLTLILDIDERLASEETKLEIKRCYTYITAPIIRTHAPEGVGDAGMADDAEGAEDTEGAEDAEAPATNVVRMIVTMGTKKYLYSTDEGADALWNDVVEHWIGNMLYKVGNNMKIFNDRQRKIGLPEIIFDRFDVVLQGGAFTVGLHPDAISLVDDGLAAQVGLARTLLNDGTLAGAVRVDAPSDEAYQLQRDQAWERWQAEHPEPEAEEDEGDEDATTAADETADAGVTTAADVAADFGGVETENGVVFEDAAAVRAVTSAAIATSDEYEDENGHRMSHEEWLELDKAAKSYENTAVPPTDEDALPSVDRDEPEPEPEQFDFDVDYSLWSVTFDDGTKRSFNATDRAFLD